MLVSAGAAAGCEKVLEAADAMLMLLGVSTEDEHDVGNTGLWGACALDSMSRWISAAPSSKCPHRTCDARAQASGGFQNV